jgi:membrane protein YqaA with SNARE-associated domain
VKWVRSIGGTLALWGPWGILLLAILDSAGIPLVGGVDALLVLMGAKNPRMAYLAAALAVAGSLAGNLFLFYLARKGGEAYLDRKLRTGRARKFRAWFHRYGTLTVFIPALVPVPLPVKVFVLSAGALGMNPWRFALVILAARAPRYFGLAFLGTQLGDKPLFYLKHHSLQLLGFSAALFLLLLLLVKLRERRGNPRLSEPS